MGKWVLVLSQIYDQCSSMFPRAFRPLDIKQPQPINDAPLKHEVLFLGNGPHFVICLDNKWIESEQFYMTTMHTTCFLCRWLIMRLSDYKLQLCDLLQGFVATAHVVWTIQQCNFLSLWTVTEALIFCRCSILSLIFHMVQTPFANHCGKKNSQWETKRNSNSYAVMCSRSQNPVLSSIYLWRMVRGKCLHKNNTFIGKGLATTTPVQKRWFLLAANTSFPQPSCSFNFFRTKNRQIVSHDRKPLCWFSWESGI